VGRNWLAALVGAVVAPYAALHVDISALAGNAHGVGFNGRLAGKLFCCVDELHASAFAAGGRRMMEALKVTLTAETRDVNPKYGKQTVEFNRLRVLILSNHRDAMPLDDEDRRFLVIRNPDTPKPVAYYTKLYALLADAAFVAAVRQHLLSLDVARLVMGRAPATAAKAAMIEATEPEYVVAVREAVERTDADLVTTAQIKRKAKGVEQPWQLQQAMRAIGAAQHPARVRVEGRKERVWVLHNHARWMRASDAAVGEYLRAKTTGPAGPAGPAVSKTTATSPLIKKFV
jgi:hypothetical protein